MNWTYTLIQSLHLVLKTTDQSFQRSKAMKRLGLDVIDFLKAAVNLNLAVLAEGSGLVVLTLSLLYHQSILRV